MRRAIVPLALGLALVTGAVLHSTQVVVLSPAAPLDGDSRDRAIAALIRRFYDAIDEVFATGNIASLTGILDAGFVDHSAPAGPPLERDDFVGSLQSLHTVAPALRLEALDIVVQDDRAAAMVGTSGGGSAVVLGIPVSPASLWGATDLFHVEEDRIAERWGDPTGLALLSPLLAADVPIAGPPGKVVTLERWIFAPAAVEARGTTSASSSSSSTPGS